MSEYTRSGVRPSCSYVVSNSGDETEVWCLSWGGQRCEALWLVGVSAYVFLQIAGFGDVESPVPLSAAQLADVVDVLSQHSLVSRDF